MKDIKTVIYRRADASHIAGFLALQEENLLTNVPEEAHAGGFVTTPFTEEQLRHMLAKEDIFVAVHEGEVVGYLVAASWPYLSQYLIFAYMVTLLPTVTQFGEMLSEHNSYQYGPICVAKAWRGTGVFERLFTYGRLKMQAKYPYALTFVNKRNKRSRTAHERKLGLHPLQEFTFSGQHFHMYGFTTDVTREGYWQQVQNAAEEMA
jgi:hypothetical protein